MDLGLSSLKLTKFVGKRGGFLVSELLPEGFTVGDSNLQPGGGFGTETSIREIGNILDDGTGSDRYKFVYSGHTLTYTGDNVYVHWATSADGTSWTKKGRLITARALEDPRLVKHDGTYYLYAEDKADVPFRNIRCYTATDMEGTWTDQGDVLDIGTGWEAQDVSSPVVWVEGSTWYMLYEGRNTSSQGSIGLATSSDGLSWTKEASNPVIERGTDIWMAEYVVPNDIWKANDGTYVFLVHGQSASDTDTKMSVLTSADLLTWTPQPNAELPFPKHQLECAFFPVGNNMKYILLHSQSVITVATGKCRLVDSGIASSLVVNFTGTNGQTTFTDESGWATSLTANGDVQIQDNRAVFDGTGDYITAIDDPIFQLDDYNWTFEAFGVDFDVTTGNQNMMSKFGDNQFSWQFSFRGDLSPKRLRILGYTAATTGSFFVDSNWTPTPGVEYDICMEREGTTGRIYVDGTMIGSGSLGTNRFFKNSAAAVIGGNLFGGGGGFVDGTMAAVRLTKGKARYASDSGYTVPSLPLTS